MTTYDTDTGQMFLVDDDLGTLHLGPIDDGSGGTKCNDAGYIVADWQLGFPLVREVVRPKALANGEEDDTQHLGARIMTINVAIDRRKGDTQLAIDAVMPYMRPSRRPRVVWTIPGSTQVRSLLVRAVDAPVTIQGKQLNTVVLSFKGPRGVVESPDESSVLINPGEDTEDGRTYDLTFDRSYPPSLGLGDRLVRNEGNEIADWDATIFGPCTNPVITVNGVDMAFNQVGGLALLVGQTLVVSSRDQTAFLNGDPAESRYDKLNFTDWSWSQVRLQPGDNIVRYEADAVEGSMQFRWRSAWL